MIWILPFGAHPAFHAAGILLDGKVRRMGFSARVEKLAILGLGVDDPYGQRLIVVWEGTKHLPILIRLKGICQ